MSAKSKVKPHPFLPGPADEADMNGLSACRTCNILGKRGDQRHTMPAAPEDARQRAAGEREG